MIPGTSSSKLPLGLSLWQSIVKGTCLECIGMDEMLFIACIELTLFDIRFFFHVLPRYSTEPRYAWAIRCGVMTVLRWPQLNPACELLLYITPTPRHSRIRIHYVPALFWVSVSNVHTISSTSFSARSFVKDSPVTWT